jgi:predicted PurR-regulated permease PerM
MTPPSLEPPDVPAAGVEPLADSAAFLRRVLLATCGLLLFVLSIYVLEKFRTILQPLFIGLLISYLILPIHAWLVRRGMHPYVAYAAILLLMLLALVGVGLLVFSNYEQATARLPEYERQLERIIRDVAESTRLDVPGMEVGFLREIPLARLFSSEQILGATRAVLGTFLDFTTWLAVTFIYLVFLVIEKERFPNRILLAFGPGRGGHVLTVIASINLAIAQYLSVKTLVSLLAGVLSTIVLLLFGVDFAITWGLLIFLLNYIPYLGSLVATALPILLSFVQFDNLGVGVVVALLLIGIQQAIGNFLEPRMTGQRLDVSPLLILLALAFWGVVWGVVGMILSVPLLVSVKIVLDNIKETKPIAILISNA